MTWAQTYTGRAVDLLNPDPESICLEDIAVSLSRQARSNGHTVGTSAYSVAQHSHWCEQALPADTPPALRLAVLLHDGHESYIGDIIRPVLDVLPLEARAAIGRLKRGLDVAIFTACGVIEHLPVPGGGLDIVVAIDRLALAAEKRDIMAPEPRPWGDLPDASEAPPVEPLTAWAASYVFTARVRQLVRECGASPLPTFGLYGL